VGQYWISILGVNISMLGTFKVSEHFGDEPIKKTIINQKTIH
jgi:hypothetical protein